MTIRAKIKSDNHTQLWRTVALKNIGSFSKGSGITKDLIRPSGLKAVRYGELYTRYHYKITDICTFIDQDTAKLATPIKAGDILFAGSGETIEEIGKSAAYLIDEIGYAGGDIIIFRPESCNSIYLSYLLNTGESRRRLTELGQGQSVVHIYKKDLEDVVVNLPLIEEQNRIVTILETWDSAIEALQTKIKLKKNIKKGLLQNLLSGKNRLPGFSGKWTRCKLGDISHIKTGKKDNVNKVVGGEYPFFVRSPIIERIDTYSFDGEAILIPGEGNIGKIIHYVDGKFDFHQRVYKISNFTKNVSGKFIYYLLAKNFEQHTKKHSVKATVDSLRLPTFTEFEFNLPDLVEQQAIVLILTNEDLSIEILQKKLKIIQSQKHFLLNNLVTGIIRTPEDLLEKVK